MGVPGVFTCVGVPGVLCWGFLCVGVPGVLSYVWVSLGFYTGVFWGFIQMQTNEAMSAKDWFGVGCRLASMPLFFYSVTQLLTFISVRFDFSATHSYGFSESLDPQNIYFVYAAAYFGLGMIFLRCPPFLMNFAYPPNETELDEERLEV